MGVKRGGDSHPHHNKGKRIKEKKLHEKNEKEKSENCRSRQLFLFN